MNAWAGSVADPFLQSQIASPKLSLDSIARNVKDGENRSAEHVESAVMESTSTRHPWPSAVRRKAGAA
jgi:hypothetical protein